MARKLIDKNIILLSNPASGYNRRAGLNAIDKIARDASIQHLQASTPESIQQALMAVSVSPEIIAINGGDGTVDAVITLLRTRKIFAYEPSLALLRGGTTNMIHGDCGFPGRPARALSRLIAENRNVTLRQPLKISREGEDLLYGFFLGTGALPRAIMATRENLHKWKMTGSIGEMLAAAAILCRLKFRSDLEKDPILRSTSLSGRIDDESQTMPHIFMAITSLKKLILNKRMEIKDGKSGILFMGPDRRLEQRESSSITLDLDEPWVLDGEFFPPARITVEADAPLRFLKPA